MKSWNSRPRTFTEYSPPSPENKTQSPPLNHLCLLSSAALAFISRRTISKYFTATNPKITEHGPEWSRSRLPFLGKTFVGIGGCLEYFKVLSETLEMRLPSDAFPSASGTGWVVDISASTNTSVAPTSPSSPTRTTLPTQPPSSTESGKGIVTVVGKGIFIARKTRKEWSEQFIYRFSGFDQEGRIGNWEIWADPLSAWVAVGGGMDDLGSPGLGSSVGVDEGGVGVRCDGEGG